MTSKILATFRCDPELWQRFKAVAKSRNTNASALLLQFIDCYLEENLLPQPKGNCIDKISSRCLDDKLSVAWEQRLVDELEERLDMKLNSTLTDALKSYGKRLDWLEGVVARSLASLQAPNQLLKEQQTALEPNPDWQKIRQSILKCLGVGSQAKLYKRVKAELDRIIF